MRRWNYDEGRALSAATHLAAGENMHFGESHDGSRGTWTLPVRMAGFGAFSALLIGASGSVVAATPVPTAPLSVQGARGQGASVSGASVSGARGQDVGVQGVSVQGAGPAQVAPVPQYEKQRLAWATKNCSTEARDAADEIQVAGVRVECATYSAPMSWAKPSLGSLRVHLTRVPRIKASSDQRPTRVLFVNPGGPGARADWFAPFVAGSEPELRKLFDIVAMDVRGTGRSTPMMCATQPDGVVDYGALTDAKVIAAMQTATKKTVADCSKRYNYVLPHINTANTMRDLDLARRLYGVKTADFYGVSAGTWLGARLVQDFPAVYQRVVLDSNVEFTSSWRTSFAHQPAGFQRRFSGQFVPWLARQDAKYRLGATPEAVMESIASLRSGFATVGGRTPARFDDLVTRRMYNDTQFTELAQLLAQWKGGSSGHKPTPRTVPPAISGAPLAADEDGVFMAVPCNDSVWTTDPASYVSEAKSYLDKKYTLIGATFAANWCATWPHKPTGTTTPTGRPGAKILMVQSEFDPATPLAGAKIAHARNTSTRMVTVTGSGMHGVYMSGVPCVEKVVTPYLVSGTYPAADATCAGIPLPLENSTYPLQELTSSGQRPVAAAQRTSAVPADVQRRLDAVRSRFYTQLSPTPR